MTAPVTVTVTLNSTLSGYCFAITGKLEGSQAFDQIYRGELSMVVTQPVTLPTPPPDPNQDYLIDVTIFKAEEGEITYEATWRSNATGDSWEPHGYMPILINDPSVVVSASSQTANTFSLTFKPAPPEGGFSCG